MQIMLPMLQVLLIVIAFGLCGFLFVSVKKDLHGSERRRKEDLEKAASRITALENELAGLRKEMEALPSLVATPAGAGINLNKRTQALRMMKLGEGPEHIAAALSLPRKEVELLVKVQRMLLDPANVS
jgi:hypothetical protein